MGGRGCSCRHPGARRMRLLACLLGKPVLMEHQLLGVELALAQEIAALGVKHSKLLLNLE
eukprot:15208971-Alexandrium_andersonii.AAC.1